MQPKGVEAGKISGAVGTFANISPFVEEYVCEHLGIRAQEISTQVLPRDLHAEYVSAMALIATSIENLQQKFVVYKNQKRVK